MLQKRTEFYQEQLFGLAKYLKEYKKENNCYPGNNEALAKIVFNGKQYPIYVEFKKTTKGFIRISRPNIAFVDREIIDDLQRKQDNKLPADPWLYDFSIKREGVAYNQYNLIINENEVPFILKSKQVVDWWHFIPYLYENRTGFNESAFGASVVNDDTHQHFSCHVDDGIYVYSIVAMHYAQELEQNSNHMIQLNRYTNNMIVIFILSIVGLTVKMYLSRERKKILLFCTLITYGVASFVIGYLGRDPMDFMRYHTSYINPVMIQKQKDMLNLYLKNNVITQEVYDKQIAALILTPTVDAEIKQKEGES